MSFNCAEKFSFKADWFQDDANVIRSFYLYYFPNDSTVELFDIRAKKLFLRRTKIENISIANFYLGARVVILSREMTIVSYADPYTDNKLSQKFQRTFSIILPERIPEMGSILSSICNTGLILKQCKMFRLNVEQAKHFYQIRIADSALLLTKIENILSGPVIAIELIGENPIEKLQSLANEEAQSLNERTPSKRIQGKFENGFYYSPNCDRSAQDIEFFFPTAACLQNKFRTSTQFDNSILCIIKPHAVSQGLAGKIVSSILENEFLITGMQMATMERANCEEFYEVYKGVVPEYAEMALCLANGPCLALEIVAKQPDTCTYKSFREFCGPVDPDIARKIRPQTLRAMFGVDKIENAVHCTDLEEDCLLELEYFFRILAD